MYSPKKRKYHTSWKNISSFYYLLSIFRLKNIDETRNYLIEEINWNEFTSKMYKKVCITLSYIEDFLILASAITGCVSISSFTSLVGIPKGIMISATPLEISTYYCKN